MVVHELMEHELHSKVGAALVVARGQGHDPFAAIEANATLDSFSASVKEAAELARGRISIVFSNERERILSSIASPPY